MSDSSSCTEQRAGMMNRQAATTLLHHVSSCSRPKIVMIYTFCNGTPHIKLHLLLSSTARSSVRKLSTPICWETMLQVGNHHSLCVLVFVCVCVMNGIVVGLPNHQPLLCNLDSALPLFVRKFSNIPKLPKGNTIFWKKYNILSQFFFLRKTNSPKMDRIFFFKEGFAT
jgi:hypothetical protein